MLASLKSLNKLPNTRVFIAAEKWMVRSTGVGGWPYFSSKQEPAMQKNSWQFFVDAIFCFLRFVSKREGQIQLKFDE